MSYHFVSIPKAEPVPLTRALSGSVASVASIEVPTLRIGTLNSLMTLSDDLSKIDNFVEGTALKLNRQLTELRADNDRYVQTSTGDRVPVESYLGRFTWNTALYNVSKSLKETVDSIQKKVHAVGEELKVKAGKYSAIKGALSNILRKDSGSLLVRDLTPLLRKEDFVSSEYLNSLAIIVPKFLYKDWMSSYEKLGEVEMVVPRSSKKIYEDNEYGIFSVTLFRKVESDYRLACQKNRFTVRDVTFEDGKSDNSRAERSRLEGEEEELRQDLIRWCNISYSDVFAALVHLKVIRTFVESILRFGLPPNFQIVCFRAKSKTDKRVLENLSKQYSSLGGEAFDGVMDKDDMAHAAVMGGSEFYPFVYVQLKVDDVETN